MKKLLFAVTALLTIFLMSGINLNAQTKIGWIKSDELLAAMPERDSAIKQLEKQRDEILRTLEEMNVVYNNTLEKYTRQRDSLSNFVRQSREAELYDMQVKIQNFQQAGDVEMQRRQQELLQPIIDKAQKAIKAVAEENKFLYILDISTGAALYYPEDPAYDILPLVKTKLGLK
ncbi:MAG: OmpH family outer membrane protein [Bacteroidales bacterium]